MKNLRIVMVLMLVGILAAGCSQEADVTAPQNQQTGYDKNGTETLGLPTIEIADGSCFAQGGVGMVGKTEGTLEIEVPAGTINQVLLYWAGGTTGAPGDDTVSIDGTAVTGELIGGPTNFFSGGGVSYYFSAFRADITGLGLVTNGLNSFTITDFNFDFTGGNLDENNGIGMLVIYDDGTTADLQVLDGLDLAFYQFSDPLDATVPQTFTFAAEAGDRMARMVIFAGSVGFDRPNGIKITTSAGEDLRENLLGSTDDLLWDTLCLEDVFIPAGDTSVTVELISTPVSNPLGASLGWVGAGLALPETRLYCLGDFVWFDENCNGCQDEGEMGVEGVEVNLWVGCPPQEIIATTTTDADGSYQFCELLPGDYTVQFVAPSGYVFTEQYACGFETDSNPGEDGITECVTIVDADDFTIDAGLCMPQDGCTLTIGFWKTHAGFGPQDDVLSQYLPIWLGEDTGAKSLGVTTAAMAVDVLKQKTYGHPSNGITKLYAQMLAAKLNVASGASDGAIADYLDDADAFLAEYDYTDWDSLSMEMKDDVMMWHDSFDKYNNGYIGPGHCDDDDDDDDDDMEMFK